MLLYHGSNADIRVVDLAKCQPYKDFGTGFYLTVFQEQAKTMAVRTARLYGGNPTINVFETDDDILLRPNLRCLDFGEHVSRDWALFVLNNRNRDFTNKSDPLCNLDGKYDIVAGPVANDNITMLFRQFQNAFIDLDMLIRKLTFHKITNQDSFHTSRALYFLHKKETFDGSD